MKCMGCGALLQDTDPLQDGYTPKLTNKLCQRCFKIQNYGANIASQKNIITEKLLAKINREKGFVIFLVDFLNIYAEIITTYQKIKLPKIMVITKSDLIPRNIKKDQLVKNLKNQYHIKEKIIWVSSKRKENLNLINDILAQENKVFLLGFTNSGKSSLINALTDSNLTISKRANTTLDLLKIKTSTGFIYDTPGFIPEHFLDNMLPKRQIKPVVYQLKNKYCLKINDYYLASDVDNNMILYLANTLNVSKRLKKEVLPKQLAVLANSDIIIKGLGFIVVKKKALITTNIAMDLIEIRPTIIGGKNE